MGFMLIELLAHVSRKPSKALRVTYAATSTGHPAPIVKSAAEIGDFVGWVFRVVGLDQMVIVLVLNVGHGGMFQRGICRLGFGDETDDIDNLPLPLRRQA